MRHFHSLALTSSLVNGPVKFLAKSAVGAEPFTTDHQQARLYTIRQGPYNLLKDNPRLNDTVTRVHVAIDEQGVHVKPVRPTRRRRVHRRPPALSKS